MKEYQTYIFDFDGTTFDSAASMGPIFRAGFEAIGRTCSDKDALEYMHHSLEWLAKEKGFEDQLQEFVDAIAIALDTPENLKLVHPFPETKEVVEELKKRGKKLAIVSGNITNHIKLILELQGMEGLFDAIVGSDQLNKPKPEPDGILLACKKLGVEADRDVIYVGDSNQDIMAARNAEVDEALVDRSAHYLDLVCTKIESLKDLLL